MLMFKAAMAVAAIMIGAIAALLGAIVLISALSSGSIQIIQGAIETSETTTVAADPSEFYRLVALFGLAPFAGGAIAAWLGWRAIA